MKRIAVLGASGFVGVRLVEMFHLGGKAEVRPIVHRPASIAPLARFRLDVRVADHHHPTALAQALAGCDTLVHLAVADAPVIRAMTTPVYAAAEQAGVRRIIFMSSASVHGQAPEAGTTEASPLPRRHLFAYNAAKAEAERRLLAARAGGKTQLVILRPGIVWGPRSRWVTDAVQAAQAGKFGWLNGGRGSINPIYVDNLVQAIELAGIAPVDGGIFLLNDPAPGTWREFFTPWIEAAGLKVEDIPEAAAYIAPRGLSAKFERMRVHPWSQQIAPKVPDVMKRGLKAIVGALPKPQAPDQFAGMENSNDRSPAPLTQEMTELQRCAWRFPVERAKQQLGWQPAVDWPTAVERTLGWLRFAELLPKQN